MSGLLVAATAVSMPLMASTVVSPGPAAAFPVTSPTIRTTPPVRIFAPYLEQTGSYGGHFTASTFLDLGPTPYYLSIFDHTSHQLVAVCGTGSSCSGSAAWPPGENNFHEIVAYLGGYPYSDPPANLLGTSNSVWIGTRLT